MGATFLGLKKEGSSYLAGPGWGLLPPRSPPPRPQQGRDEAMKSETLEVQDFLNATEGVRTRSRNVLSGILFQ